MTDIKSMLLSELQEDFALRGLQKFRAAQVYRWLHQRGATSFDEMTDLSKDLRVALKESFEIRNTEIAIRRVSKIDGTKKYLFRLNDGEMIESVLMKYKHGYSICISTQVGCKMGCTFCATGKSGFFNVLEFLESEGYIRFQAEASASSKELYESYRLWCEENSMTALKNRSFSDAMIAVQAKYNLEHCNTIKNSAGRRVWGFTGVKVITKPSYTDGFMDDSQCTYVPKEWTN